MSSKKCSLSSGTKKFLVFGSLYVATAKGLTLFILSLCTDARIDIAANESKNLNPTSVNVSIDASQSQLAI